MRRRRRGGSFAIVLIVAIVILFGVLRSVPRAPLTGLATATATALLPVTPTSPPRPTATATPVPTIAIATIPPATATSPPAAPEATATPTLIRPTPPTQPPTAPVATPSGALAPDVQAIRVRDLPETNSVTVLVLGGEEIHLDDTREVYPASTVKLPIYLTLAHRIRTGEVGVTWETPITVQKADIVGGTGILQNAPGSTHTVREIAQLMMTESDNVAANILLGRLGGAQDTSREHLLAGAAVVDAYLATLGVHGMTLRHGLQDNQAYANGTLSTTTSDALAQIMLLTERDRTTLDGGPDVLALLGERGTHNPWHPSDAVACGLTVQRIGGIYPASADRPGVRLDTLIIATPGSAVRYILAVAVPTTPALEPTVETQIARFEGDLQFLLTGHWAQCVDSTTRQG
ncbi:MAG TPA: serine hydrolase [Thermomicrobiales bacterium]